VQLLQRVLEADPGYGRAHLELGLWRRRHGQPERAAWHLERAAARQAGGEETRLRLAEALQAAGRKADAAYQRGRYFQATQQLRRAIREYQRLAALEPDRKDVPLLLSAAYSQIEQDDQAAAVARQGIERHPGDPDLQARYAQLLMMSGDRAAGTTFCREWIQREPGAAEPHRLLARSALDALRPAEAAQLLEQAIDRDPRNAEYHRELARALTAQPTPPNLRRAAAALRRAVTLAPRDAESCLRLGEVLERLGDLEGARRQYQRSMDRDRSVRYGAYSLSQLCPRLGKAERRGFYAENVRVLREREDAARLLWRQVYQTPEDADAHARLAGLLLTAGDLRQARHQLEQVVRLRPERREEQRQLQVLERILSMREG
jgi:tetratricopeptide (TPR) repeat protein